MVHNRSDIFLNEIKIWRFFKSKFKTLLISLYIILLKIFYTLFYFKKNCNDKYYTDCVIQTRLEITEYNNILMMKTYATTMLRIKPLEFRYSRDTVFTNFLDV